MAILIEPNKNDEHVFPVNNVTFQLKEINNIIGGMAEIAFFDDVWIFTNKLAYRTNLPYNERASLMFCYPIFGPCLVSTQFELPSQFFYPDNEAIDDVIETNNLDENISIDDDRLYDNDEIYSNCINVYNRIFDGRIYNDIFEHFIIPTVDGDLNITKDAMYQKVLLETLMKFFTRHEDYERCIELKNLLNYLQ